jgi:hypothetical protein
MQDVSAPLADSVKSEREARHIVAQLNEQGASACAPYPATWRRHCSMSANGAFVRPDIPSA